MRPLVGCDLETTGIVPRKGRILELAFEILNENLETIEKLSLITCQASELEAAFAECDDFVQKMHLKSGLWQDIADGKGIPFADAIVQVRQLLERTGCTGLDSEGNTYRAPLLGSTIGFDLKWLEVHAPEIARLVHYRTVDVSSIRELVDRWYADGVKFKANGGAVHRAADDLRYSIELLRYYKRTIFTPYHRVPQCASS